VSVRRFSPASRQPDLAHPQPLARGTNWRRRQLRGTPGGAISVRRQLVGTVRLAPFPERQSAAASIARCDGRPMWANTRRATPCARACSATCSAAMCPPAPRANRIGRFQPAASANIRSAPAAQSGKAQISGAHTAVAVGRRSRYPHVGRLVWATGRGSITRSATQTAATAGCSPRAAHSVRTWWRSSLRSSQTSQAASGPAGSAPGPPSSMA